MRLLLQAAVVSLSPKRGAFISRVKTPRSAGIETPAASSPAFTHLCFCLRLSSGDYAGFPGCGLLRLHSTYRHDLKIYASDEGRVQMTAAAFAKVTETFLCRR